MSRFKAFIIGGGGIFEAKHWPLDCQDFVDGLGNDLPVAIFGVGARCENVKRGREAEEAGTEIYSSLMSDELAWGIVHTAAEAQKNQR